MYSVTLYFTKLSYTVSFSQWVFDKLYVTWVNVLSYIVLLHTVLLPKFGHSLCNVCPPGGRVFFFYWGKKKSKKYFLLSLKLPVNNCQTSRRLCECFIVISEHYCCCCWEYFEERCSDEAKRLKENTQRLFCERTYLVFQQHPNRSEQTSAPWFLHARRASTDGSRRLDLRRDHINHS